MKQNGADGDFEQELLIKRNLNWIPVITKAINQKSSFFAVGAGHLGGETGLLNLLKKELLCLKLIVFFLSTKILQAFINLNYVLYQYNQA